MIRVHSMIFGIATLLVVATAASSEDRPRPSQATLPQTNPVNEVVAGSEQPEASREAGQAPAAEPLAGDEESGLADANASRQQLRALLGSSMLALSQVEREDRQDRFERSRSLGSDWFYGADRARPPRLGRGPGWGMSSRGRPFGAGRRGRGGRGGSRF